MTDFAHFPRPGENDPYVPFLSTKDTTQCSMLLTAFPGHWLKGADYRKPSSYLSPPPPPLNHKCQAVEALCLCQICF